MRRLVIMTLLALECFASCNRGDKTPGTPTAASPGSSSAPSPSPHAVAGNASESLPPLPPEIVRALFRPHREPVFPVNQIHRFQRPDGVIVTRSVESYPKLKTQVALRKIENLERRKAAIHLGTAAAPGAWPWEVVFLDGIDLPQCGGTLIAEDWVLTAAHCYPTPGDIVRVGTRNLASQDGQTAHAGFVCTHPDFDYGTLESDVALVRLQETLTQPFASLTPDATHQAAGTSAMAVGWGRSDPNIPGPANELQNAPLPILPTATCQAAYPAPPAQFLDGMMCAGEQGVARGPCVADSGGPLLVEESPNNWLQIGVTSWGDVCQLGIFPYGVFTKVSDFNGWINDVLTATNVKCQE